MELLTKTGIIALIIFTLVGCDGNPRCSNNNPILNGTDPTSSAYNIELVRLINTTDEGQMEYYFDSYIKTGNTELIVVRAQGADFCAKGTFLVNDWTGIEGIQNAGGKGYSGAELEGFTFTIDGSTEPIQLIYASATAVID